MQKRKQVLGTGAILIIILACLVGWMVFKGSGLNPSHFGINLNQSAAEIKKSLLSETPLGTPRDDVLAMIQKHGWKTHPLAIDRASKTQIAADLGESWNGELVSAYWKLDGNGRLKDIELQTAAAFR